MQFSAFTGLALIAFLVLANGFFVATEFAIVAVRRSRLQELADEGRLGATAALQVVSHLDAYIAATQFGITLASLALGWIGEPALADILEPPLELIVGKYAVGAAHSIAIGVAFFLITGVHIVVGELAPKGLALQKPETTTLWVARPIQLFHAIFKWPVTALNAVGNATLRVLGLKPAAGHEMVHSVEELRLLVEGMERAGVVDRTEARLAGRAFDFGEVFARAIMTPRTELEAVPIDANLDDLFDAAETASHSRLAVYDGSIDNIVGLLHVRRLLKYRKHPPEDFQLRSLLQQPLIVPETKNATALLEEMRRHRNYASVVVDEYGGTAGMVTVTDLVQTLVGRMDDEVSSTGETRGSAAGGGAILLDGLIRISEFEEIAGVTMSDDYGGVETLGGLVSALLGRVPAIGDRVILGGRTVIVESLDGWRIATVRVLPRSPEP
jgi:magnesium and cobalt exporter, CNNM family